MKTEAPLRPALTLGPGRLCLLLSFALGVLASPCEAEPPSKAASTKLRLGTAATTLGFGPSLSVEASPALDFEARQRTDWLLDTWAAELRAHWYPSEAPRPARHPLALGLAGGLGIEGIAPTDSMIPYMPYVLGGLRLEWRLGRFIFACEADLRYGRAERLLEADTKAGSVRYHEELAPAPLEVGMGIVYRF